MPTLTATETPETTSTQTFTIDVAVTVQSPGVATWAYNGKSQLTIIVEPGEALIELNLQGNAAWVTNPVNWYNAMRQPIPTPQQLTVNRADDILTNILDVNDNSSDVTQAFHFLLTVVIDGTTYTSPDPTIINHKPGG